MTRLKVELQKRNIIFDEDDVMIALKGMEYDRCAKLVSITDKFIITVMYSAVMDPILYIYDRFTFKPIAEQQLYKDIQSFGCGYFNPWYSMVYEECMVEEY